MLFPMKPTLANLAKLLKSLTSALLPLIYPLFSVIFPCLGHFTPLYLARRVDSSISKQWHFCCDIILSCNYSCISCFLYPMQRVKRCLVMSVFPVQTCGPPLPSLYQTQDLPRLHSRLSALNNSQSLATTLLFEVSLLVWYHI